VPVTGRILATESLRVVGRAGIGVDNVDLEAAADHGVTVVHHPTYSIDEVATHALSLLLAGIRRLPCYDDRSTRSGEWTGPKVRRSGDSRGRPSGSLGFGKIPRRLATMVQGFGCELLAHDPYVPENVVRSHNVEPVGFEDLLSAADALSVHTPLTEETAGMLDEAALDTMADDAVIVNTARGNVIDTDALVAALDDDAIGFAALDVTDRSHSPTTIRYSTPTTPS